MAIVNSFLNMQVGDKIPCRYKATSGAVGQFSELGTCTAAEIPFASSATPDGLFNFIMAGYDFMGRKLLVADRNIQHSISWDTLNSAGLITGLEVTDLNWVGVVPQMSGYSQNGFLVEQSNEYNTTYLGWKAFDKDNTTSWAITDGVGSITVTLDKAHKILGYSIRARTTFGGAGNQECPASWTVEGFVNNAWTTLSTVSAQTWTAGQTKQFPVIPQNCTKVRLNITANGGTAYTMMSEIQFYEQGLNLYTLRLPTGGINNTDRDNEWDKIIAESTLNGTITAGADSVWHFSQAIVSWASTSVSPTTRKMERGWTNNVRYDQSDLTSAATVNTGFRPVLLVESLIPPIVTKMLFLEGTDVVKFTGTTKSVVGTAPATPEMFTTHGMDNLTGLTKAHVQGMKLMYYTTDKAVTPKKITYKAAVQDKLLLMNKDINLENIDNIDFWRFTSTLSGNSLVKIIASNNGGTSWKTWNAGWQDIEATAEAVKSYGMTVPVFNALTSEWNDLLLTNDKVRFAILMSLDSPSDIVAINRIEALQVQFDGSQRWMPATPDTEYATERQTSTTVKVDLFISGDVKIYYPK